MQRQDSLYDQMKTVYDLANKAGCYDAADYIRENVLEPVAEKLASDAIRESLEEEGIEDKVKVQAPFKYFADKYGWAEVCDALGWDINWAQEGYGSSKAVVSFSQEEIDKLEGKEN